MGVAKYTFWTRKESPVSIWEGVGQEWMGKKIASHNRESKSCHSSGVISRVITTFSWTILSIYLSTYSTWSHLERRTSVKRFVSLQFLNPRQSVGPLGRGISPTQGRYLPRTTQTQTKRRQTSMPWVEFEPTIPALEGAKIFHSLDCD
jgi:hypothetical protein